jgi:hypothetical protein
MNTKADAAQHIVNKARLAREQIETLRLTIRVTKENHLRARGWKEVRAGIKWMWTKQIPIQPEIFNMLCTLDDAFDMQLAEDL